MNPSPTTVSDLLNDLHAIAAQIDACLLAGEKVQCINEAGQLYNHIRGLITPDYLIDDEYKWICDLGQAWNAEVKAYQQHNGDTNGVINEQELIDGIQDALDDLLNGFDGPDGIDTI
tara:strand:+ start:666 stop:1016 length:351 start_codon:yes stop_codon:yes gene_type:complete